MPKFSVHDVEAMENITITLGELLRRQLANMLVTSTDCKASIESVNPETGEYRIVLQGTLKLEK